MLRTTLLHRHNLNISSYQLFKSFLKNFSKGYKPKQAKSLSGSEISRFMETADDFHYLATKTILIFGFCGATRCCELVNLKMTDVEDFGNYYNVSIRESKNDYPRNFMICAPYYEIVKKYISLRPDDMDASRFFVNYAKGKCTRQVIGKHKISEVPKTIASYLNLENPDLYTGHSLRRTSATLLSDSGASFVRIKNLGAWKSDAVAQRYINHSKVTKKQNFDGISSVVNSSSFASTKANSTKTSSATSTNDVPVSVLRSSPVKNVLQQVDNIVEPVPSSESVNKSLLNTVPFQTVEDSASVEMTGEDNTSNFKENLHHDHNAENDGSINLKKKRKFERVLEEENDVYDQHGPIKFYNCENITINYNNYSCTHGHVQR